MWLGRKRDGERRLNCIETFARITNRLKPLKVGTELQCLTQSELIALAEKVGVQPVWYESPCDCHTRGCACCCQPQCGRCCACSNDGRLDFGKKQVRCLCQVRKGQRYRLMHVGFREGSVVTATSDPYINKYGSWWFDVVTSGGYHDKHSLTDHGVVPIVRGRWNQSNWMEFVDGERRPRCDECCSGCCHHCGISLSEARRMLDWSPSTGPQGVTGMPGPSSAFRCFAECCNGPNQGTRKSHGSRHVRCLRQVMKGRRYRLMHVGFREGSVVTATSDPYECDGSLRFDAVDECGNIHKGYSLADYAVVRYRNGACSGHGGWNQLDWMEFADDHRPGCRECHQERCREYCCGCD
jgi:Fe2+ transport system protein FeoA